MRFLVYGAGVLGTLYAVRLLQHGQDVTLLARNRRLAHLRDRGAILEEAIEGKSDVSRVPLTEELTGKDFYDVVLVAIRKNQLESVLPVLAANLRVPTFLFFHNNAEGWDRLAERLGRQRVLLGFPGASGDFDGDVVRYCLIPEQRTTIGEIDGSITPRLHVIADSFQKAGFPVSISRHMDAWLKTHAFLITAVAGAVYGAGGSTSRLAQESNSLKCMVNGVREGFRVLRSLRFRVEPLKLKILFEWLPSRVPVTYWSHYFSSPLAEIAFARHALAAADEMRCLVGECRVLVSRSQMPTAALDELWAQIDRYPGRIRA